jgi:hypothetical protein
MCISIYNLQCAEYYSLAIYIYNLICCFRYNQTLIQVYFESQFSNWLHSYYMLCCIVSIHNRLIWYAPCMQVKHPAGLNANLPCLLICWKTIQEHTHLIGLKIQQNFTEYFCFDMNKAGANFLLQVRGCSLLVMILFTLIYCFPFGITVIDCVTCGWPYCFLYIVWRFSVSVPPIFLSSSL